MQKNLSLEWILQQDNASCHKTKKVKNFFQKEFYEYDGLASPVLWSQPPEKLGLQQEHNPQDQIRKELHSQTAILLLGSIC